MGFKFSVRVAISSTAIPRLRRNKSSSTGHVCCHLPTDALSTPGLLLRPGMFFCLPSSPVLALPPSGNPLLASPPQTSSAAPSPPPLPLGSSHQWGQVCSLSSGAQEVGGCSLVCWDATPGESHSGLPPVECRSLAGGERGVGLLSIFALPLPPCSQKLDTSGQICALLGPK